MRSRKPLSGFEPRVNAQQNHSAKCSRTWIPAGKGGQGGPQGLGKVRVKKISN